MRAGRAPNNWFSPRWVPALGKIMGGVFTGLGGVTLLAIALSRWGNHFFTQFIVLFLSGGASHLPIMFEAYQA